MRPAALVREVGSTAWALAQIVAHLVATPVVWRRRVRWGATPDEVAATFPGDELVAEPKWGYTLGITIDAPPAQVWPWVVQIGQGRGGFYSYELLENLVGCRITNASRIVPEWQHLDVGDEVRLHPDAPPLTVAIVDPPTALVLSGAPAEVGTEEDYVRSTWGFHVVSMGGGRSRLITRGRTEYSPAFVNRLFFGRFPMEPITFVMNRRMLLTIRDLAESGAARPSTR